MTKKAMWFCVRAFGVACCAVFPGLVACTDTTSGVLAAAGAARSGSGSPDTVVAPVQQGEGSFGRAQRPYTPASPWNTPIPADAGVDRHSSAMIATILASNNGRLRSDPTRYTYPVHFVDASTPRVTMVCSGIVSVNHADGTRTRIRSRELPDVPVPPEAVPSRGTDGQLILIDVDSGDEYNIIQFAPPAGCVNMTRYVRGVHRSGVEPVYASRGAGVPYFAGLIRPWEIAIGRIEHALAFGYAGARRGRCVWPASKSDGKVDDVAAIPQGARLQLDPSLDVAAIKGLDATGRIIARALQEYGAFVIDVSGSNKLYAEDGITGQWGNRLVATTVSAIPVDRLRVLRLPDAYFADEYRPNHGRCVGG
jgi:hypothetical protein